MLGGLGGTVLGGLGGTVLGGLERNYLETAIMRLECLVLQKLTVDEVSTLVFLSYTAASFNLFFLRLVIILPMAKFTPALILER